MTSAPAQLHSDLRGDLLDGRARFPWVAGDLQTLRNTLLRPRVHLSQWAAQTLSIRFSDGDETLCFHHLPSDSVPRKGMCIAIVHGLGGDAEGSAIRYLTEALLGAGYSVARVNLRGAPMVYHLARSISHAGKSDDLQDLLTGLETALGTQRWGLIGISLGGNLTAKALGDGGLSGFDISAAMTICAPVDMQAASDRILEPRNWVYEKYLLRDLKNAVLRTQMEAPWKARAREAQTVYQFDDLVTGPFHGFESAAHYYASVSAGPVLCRLKTPTLLLTAEDDPWIPAQSYAPYACAPEAAAQMLITPRGGHVGFHFKGSAQPAYCDAAVRWFNAYA